MALTKSQLIENIKKERKNWDPEINLEAPIMAVLDKENLWDKARGMIPKEWLKEHKEEIKERVYDWEDHDRIAVLMWLYEQFGKSY